MSNSVDDPLLDHSYDGIQEYDNPLPGWWKLLFWGSILFCIPYTIYYHFMEGNSIQDQFEASMEKYGLNLNLKPDSGTILALMDDEEKLALVESKFATCTACHAPGGTGLKNLGPNLTDKHWKNIQELADIYRVLDVGVPGTAMLPQAALSKDEKVLMAAYVATLSRNPKEGLEPEGELIEEWPAASAKDPQPGPADPQGENSGAGEK